MGNQEPIVHALLLLQLVQLRPQQILVGLLEPSMGHVLMKLPQQALPVACDQGGATSLGLALSALEDDCGCM